MIISSNLKSHNGTETLIKALEYGVKTWHPCVSKGSDSPSNSSLLAGEPAWNSTSFNPPQAKSETLKTLGLPAAGLPELPGLVGFRKPTKPDLQGGAGVLVWCEGFLLWFKTLKLRKQIKQTPSKRVILTPYQFSHFINVSAAITVPLKTNRPLAVVSLLQQELKPRVSQEGEGSCCCLGEMCPVSDGDGSFSRGTFFRQEYLQGPGAEGTSLDLQECTITAASARGHGVWQTL